MKPTVPPTWKPPIRALDLAALALGGLLALVAYSLSRGGPSPVPCLVAGNGPERGPFGFTKARELAGMRPFDAPGIPPDMVIAPEGWAVPAPGTLWYSGSVSARAADRCLVPIPVNDPGFVVSARSGIDPRMIVGPRVVGLPFGPRR